MVYKEGLVVWHAKIGHAVLAAQSSYENVLMWSVLKDKGVTTRPANQFQLSCLTFIVGQAIQYNGSAFTITALEKDNNRVVVKSAAASLNSSLRTAFIPDKCILITSQALRLAVVNDQNQIVKELGEYGLEATE